MSRKGNCYDNAPMESFWGLLKNELVHRKSYNSQAEAITDVTEYIEVFYNRQRRQAALAYLSPAVFARVNYQRKNDALPLNMASEFDDLPHFRRVRFHGAGDTAVRLSSCPVRRYDFWT
jgi:hypothetical protein